MKSLSCTISLIFVASISLAQTAESLKERIQEHYAVINADDDLPTVLSHHLQEFSLFPWNGGALFESGFGETFEKMGTDFKFPKANVTMKHFNAQLYDNVGVATFIWMVITEIHLVYGE